MPVSAEGRVEHQKLNQTTALLLFGWVFGVQLDSLEKSVLANDEKRVDFIPTFVVTVAVEMFDSIADPELNSKNSIKKQQSCRLVEFLAFNSAFGRHSN